MTERKDSIRVHIDGKEFYVVGGKFQDMLAAVKQISGRRFVSELKIWQIPGLAEDVQNQLEIGGYWLEGGTPLPETTQSPQTAPSGSASDRIRVQIQGRQLAVIGGGFQEMLAEVKNLPGRRFAGDKKIWEIPGELATIKHLLETAGFQLEGAEKTSLEGAEKTSLEGAEKIPLDPVSPAEPPNFTPAGNAAPPPYEEPDLSDDDDIPPYEIPDWWEGDNLPSLSLEPPDWLEDELASQPPDEPFDNQPSPFTAEPPAPPPVAKISPPARGGDQIRIRVGGIPVVVTGGAFKEMLAVIKNIPGRRFDGNDKVWDIPGDVGLESVQQTVKAAGFVVKRG